MEREIKAIILDIGNVLVDFCYEEFFEQFVTSKEEKQRLIQATVQSKDWCELDRGILTEEEILQLFINHDRELEGVIREMYTCMDGILRLRSYVIPFIKEVREKGYEVILLSNLSDKIRRECVKDLAFESYVTGAVFSYQERCIKPEEQIYTNLLERYGLEGHQCVFVDDLEENLQAASRLGFHTVHYTTYEEVRNQLISLIDLE